MARPPLPIGSWGRVMRTQVEVGVWEARARFRDFDGITRQVRRRAKTGAAAERALVSELTERTSPAGDEIGRETRLSAIAVIWFTEIEARNLAVNTLRRYREILDDHVLPAVGGLAVREASVSRLDSFLKSVALNTGAATAKLCRTVLSGMLGLAVRHGAAPTNPLREVAGVTVVKKEPRALTLAEVAVLRDAVKAWERNETDKAGQPVVGSKRGRARTSELLDVVDMLLATGARIGEVLAIRWEDVDLEEQTVTISGTIVRPIGEPLIRQSFPKSSSSQRELELPRFAVDMLMRRRVNAASNIVGAVFPSTAGTWREPGNVRTQWRQVRAAAGYSWVTPHSFRRTVATLLDAEVDLKSASAQLGHAGTDITQRHYVQPTHRGPAVAEILNGIVGNGP